MAKTSDSLQAHSPGKWSREYVGQKAYSGIARQYQRERSYWQRYDWLYVAYYCPSLYYPLWPLVGGSESSDLRRYANLKGVDVRTVRACCADGKIPAWCEGKHWRIHPHVIGKEMSLQYIRRYFGHGNGKHPPTERDKRALEYTLVEMGLRDLEERRKYIFYHYKEHPDARSAISRPYEDIMIAADWLEMKNGKVPTAEELAKHLKMSVSKLYRIRPGIMRVIKARYREDLPTETGFNWDGIEDYND